MHFGCAWYPEHWPEARWPVDLDLMGAADMDVVRVGEFAWSRLEPADGRFDLDWLARAIDMAGERGFAVLLGTPTAAPPSWLTAGHPEVLPVDAHGRTARHGRRCHYRAVSDVYRSFCARIVERLAERFGQHPAVIGWQIDNEYWRISRDAETRASFHAWLEERYGDLATLNRAWATTYWSQEYSRWEDVPVPDGGDNPGLELAWRRFASRVYADYQRVQIAVLRRHIAPRQWITHNFHPNDDLDRAPIAADLDCISWDAYLHHRGERLDPALDGCEVDDLRCLGRGGLWITETQPGDVSWQAVNAMPAPGALRAYAWHLVGHGADAVLYWQWRSAPGGQEQYHGCLLDPGGRPRPRYAELAAVGAELRRLGPVLDGTAPANRIALVDRWCDRWPLRWQRHHRDFDPSRHVGGYYAALQRAGHACDVLERLDELGRYRLLIAPHLHLVDATTAAALLAFVVGGGHLLLGMRSGVKDPENAMPAVRQPGPLAELVGGEVRDRYALREAVALDGEFGSHRVGVFAEDLEPLGDDCAVWARYADDAGWLAGRPALLHRRLEDGSVTYCGCWPTEAMTEGLLARLLALAGLEAPLPAPPAGVEVLPREGDGRRLLILVNHAEVARRVPVPGVWRELLGDQPAPGELELPPRGVAVLADA